MRGQLLLAKSATVAVVGFVSGGLLTVISTVIAALMLGESDSVTAAELVRTPFAAGLYLALAGVLVLGVGAILRSTVVAILVSLLLILAAPTLTELSSADWLESASTFLPSTAGEVWMSPDGGAYGQGVAALILIVWAVLAQLVGYLCLWLRDA